MSGVRVLTWGGFAMACSLAAIVSWFSTPGRAVVGTLALWLLPGWLLLLLFRERSFLPAPERSATAAILGLLWTTLSAGIGVLLHRSLGFVSELYGLSSALLAVVAALRTVKTARRRPFGQSLRLKRDKGGAYWGAAALLLLLVLGLALLEISIGGVINSGDRWTYLGLIRNHVDTNHLATVSPFLKGIAVSWRQAADAWGVEIALLSRLFRADPVDLFCLYLPPILVVLGFFAYLSLARQLFRDLRLAAFGMVVVMLLWATDIQWNEGLGFVFLSRSMEDKTVAAFICYPLAMVFFLRFVRFGTRSSLLLFTLCSIASGLIHPLGPFFCAVSVGGFWLVRLASTPRKFRTGRCVASGLALLAGIAVPLLQRSSVNLMSLSPPSFTPKMIAEALAQQRYTLLVFDLRADSYMVHPTLLLHPIVLLAVILLPWIALRTKGSVSDQFLVGTMAALLVGLFNPWLAPLIGKAVTPWMLWRFTWIAPSGFIVARAGIRGLQAVRRGSRNVPQGRKIVLTGWLVFAGLTIGAVALAPRAVRSWEYLRWWNSREVNEDLRATLYALRGRVQRGSVIMTPVKWSHFVPSLAGGVYPVAFRTLEENPPDAIEDMESFYSGDLFSLGDLALLKKYDARYVLVSKGGWLGLQLSSLSPDARLLVETPTFAVFQIDEALQESEVVQGNSLLMSGEPEKARQAYALCLERGRSPELAHVGSGRAWLAEGYLAPALKEFETAVETSGDSPLLQAYLGEVLAEWSHQHGSGEASGESVRLYSSALGALPKSATLHKLLLRGLEDLPEKAVFSLLQRTREVYEQWLRRFPNDEEVGYRLVGILWLQEDHRDIVPLCLRLMRRFPRAAEPHLYLGEAYDALGNLERAIAQYERAISKNPRMAQAYLRLSRDFEKSGRIKDAIRVLKRATRAFKGHAWPDTELGRVYLHLVALADRPGSALSSRRPTIAAISRHSNRLDELAELSWKGDACVVGEPRAATSDFRTSAESLVGCS